ncbi:MAG: glutamate--tRNA ligase family protein, partial [Verrucomicrobiota bacterium]|nr:glutamate--tRNA ligase family protein [Verrucomicrobiota bacterium]
VRSDGKPVFHLVNVVDDIEMDITHVIRGEDHLSNTSKHVELFKAFGAALPKFAHIPLILNNDGSKMSKRDSGASMAAYTEGGYLPSAVVNYLSLLGWSPKDNTEMMSTAELIERFDLPGVQRANARFDMPKLDWLNFEHIRALSPDDFKSQALGQLKDAGLDAACRDADYTAAAREVKNKVLVMPARVACTGSKVGPSLYHLMEVLGQAEVLKRFDAALAGM